MRKIDEMLAELETMKSTAQNLLNEKKWDDAKAKMEEIKAFKAAIAVQKQLDEEEAEVLRGKAPAKPPESDSIKAFARAARAGFRNAMTEGANEDGGYTVPADISTQIQTLREAKDALQNHVTVVPVPSESGARTFKTRQQQTGFSKVAEGGKIGDKGTPKFTRLEYKVEKYAGYFPVTNELLADTDASLATTLIDWVGNESRVTRNTLILAAIKTVTSTALSTLDDIKKAINVTLDPAFRPYTKIYTNQDGLQYLDTLKNSDGDYLLKPSVTDPTQRILFGYPVVVISNSDFPSDVSVAGKRGIPLIIGDLKEGISLFERKGISIISTTEAMNAFETDMTIWRAIEREQVKVKDEKAFVNGKITIDDASVVNESGE